MLCGKSHDEKNCELKKTQKTHTHLDWFDDEKNCELKKTQQTHTHLDWFDDAIIMSGLPSCMKTKRPLESESN